MWEFHVKIVDAAKDRVSSSKAVISTDVRPSKRLNACT